MSISKTRFARGIVIKADDVAVDGVEGELKVAATAKKLQVYLDGALRNVVSEDQTQTLTNKTVDADNNTISNLEVDNLKAGVLDTDLTAVSASDDTIPSAKATKTYVDSVASTTATNAQTALDNHINDAADAHDASAISSVAAGNLAATNVQDALNELQSDIDTRATASALTDHINDAADAHDASAISSVAAGNLAATNVQDALNELQTDIDTRATSANLTTHENDTSTHGVTGTILGTTDAQVITNKDIDGGTASNTSRITIPKNTKTNLDALTRKEGTLVYSTDLAKAFVDNGSELVEVGSGGAGGINYIDNSDAETDTAGYTKFNDGASSPVDGTGGIVNAGFLFERTTSGPLRDTASFLITKPNSNVQGHGVSYDFDIDSADQAQILRVSFDYSSDSGYADDYLRCYIFDRTSSQLIEVIDRSISASATGKYIGSFQTPSNSTALRLIFFVSDSSSTAWTMKLDSISVSPQTLTKGAVVTDWKSFTPTGSHTTNTTYSGMWRRVGDMMEVKTKASFSGANTQGVLTVNIPSGYTIDTTKFPTAAGAVIGKAWFLDASFSYFLGDVMYESTTSVRPRIYTDDQPAGGAYVILGSIDTSTGVPSVIASGDTVEMTYSVPIVGWSSNVILSSDEGGQRQVVFRGYRSAALSLATSSQKIPLDAVTRDTVSGFDSTNGRYVVQESGDYDISARAGFQSIADTGQAMAIIRVNGSDIVYGSVGRQGTAGSAGSVVSDTRYLNKGDYVELYVTQNDSATEAVDVGSLATYLVVAKRSSPQTLAGSETVAASYGASTTQSFLTSTATTIIYNSKVVDSHNAMNTTTGIWTCPTSGTYLVTAGVALSDAGTWAAGEYIEVLLRLDSSSTLAAVYKTAYEAQAAATNSTPPLTKIISITKGQTLSIRLNQTSGSTLVADGTLLNHISIIRVGN